MTLISLIDKITTNPTTKYSWRTYNANLSTISIFVVLFVGLATIYLGIQTGYVLVEIKELNERQFGSENFPPRMIFDGGDVILQGGINSFFDLKEPVFVGAISNHYLDFTITDASLNNINGKFGECYFKADPEIKTWIDSSTVWTPRGDMKPIKPELIMKYSVNTPFIAKMNSNSSLVSHIVGGIKYEITVVDIQDPSQKFSESHYADLLVYAPSDQTEKFSSC